MSEVHIDETKTLATDEEGTGVETDGDGAAETEAGDGEAGEDTAAE